MAFPGLISHPRRVTGTGKTRVRARTKELTGRTGCPFVPLHSVIVTATRGDRIRTTRELRGLSRDQLATATGVNSKTIARIERGEVTNSPSAPILERHLGIPHTAEEPPAPSLHDISDLDLIAELARRLAARRSHDATEPLGPEGYFRWPTEAAPYPEAGNTATERSEEVADGGGPA